ncbi:MAG: PEP/pyruvate-binding domain-containing protein [Planctomycetota bacterium]
MAQLLLRLDDGGPAAATELVGGKAAGLLSLCAAGFLVPPGFVLTADAFRLQFQRSPFADGESVSGAELKDALALMQQALLDTDFHPAVEAALQEGLSGLDPSEGPLAVRSSATLEDREGASFAGLFDTVLNVRGGEEVRDAVKRCWSSLCAARVLEYARRATGGLEVMAMAVIVQQLVPAEQAGVAFTVNPVTGDEGEVVIEAVRGLGEALVSGQTNADRYRVELGTGHIRARECGGQTRMTEALTECSGTRTVEMAPGASEGPILTDEHAAAIADIAARVHEHFGRPMDIEWAIAADKVHLLQARPITSIAFSPDLGEWTTADFREGGVAAGDCAPLMWSLYEHALEQSLPAYFKLLHLLPEGHEAKWGRMFFGRPYWNLGETKRALAKIPGYSERSFDQSLGVEITYDGEGQTTPVTAGGIVSALPVLFALKRSYREHLEVDRLLMAGFEERTAPFDLEADGLRALEPEAFAERYAALIEDLYLQTETAYFTTIYNTSNAKLDLKPHLDRAARAVGGDLDVCALMGGLEDISHLRPVQDMHALFGELREEKRELTDADVEAFARRWRHKSRRELDIRIPRWEDDLPFVRAMLESGYEAFDPQRSPQASVKEQRRRYREENDRVLRALRWRPLARRGFHKALALVRTYAWWREELRDVSTQVYALIRRWSVEAARRLVDRGVLEEAGDIFMLGFPDVIAAAQEHLDPGAIRERVHKGRRLLRAYRNFEPPNEIGRGHRCSVEEAIHAPLGDVLRGTGGASGRYRGCARVVRSLEAADHVQAGEVLVATFTDPGWTPLLGRVAAVVTETGGMLSHAAVIAREYGIPAVLAVSGATRTIPDGSTVIVDGDRGTVELVDLGETA